MILVVISLNYFPKSDNDSFLKVKQLYDDHGDEIRIDVPNYFDKLYRTSGVD